MSQNPKIISLTSAILFLLSLSSIFSFNIPSKYISSPSFISMINKSQKSRTILYASPKNNYHNSCSKNNPCALEKALKLLNPGYTLYLTKGVYNVGRGINIKKSGKPDLYIVISSAPNEKVIITSSKTTKEVSLFKVSGSYIIIENLTFGRVTALDVQGIVFYEGGQHNIIIRNNKFTELKSNVKIIKDEKKRGDKANHGANGILIQGEKKLIKQIIIYKNELTNNVLGYSEAISIAGNCEEIYVLNNTLKNNNNIGIDFNGNNGIAEQKKLDQPRKSVAMYNIIQKSLSPYDDCAGLYVDGAKDIYLAENTITDSQYGIEIGAEEKKNDVKNIIVTNNKVIRNTITGIRVGGYDEKHSGWVKDSVFKKNHISGSPTGIIIAKVDNISFEENEIIVGEKKRFVKVEFSSSSKNIKFKSNLFSGNGNFKIHKNSLSLSEFIKKNPSNKKK